MLVATLPHLLPVLRTYSTAAFITLQMQFTRIRTVGSAWKSSSSSCGFCSLY